MCRMLSRCILTNARLLKFFSNMFTGHYGLLTGIDISGMYKSNIHVLLVGGYVIGNNSTEAHLECM